jgi:hypothetical protein
MFHDFVVKNRASIWLAFAVLIVSAVMHAPTFASMIALGIEAVLLIVLRWCAHVEGRLL